MSVQNVEFEQLMDEVKLYMHKQETLDKIQDAYNFALEKHDGQYRRSGEPYITHTVQVAYTLAQLRTGPSVIIAGLLHDVIEDSDVSWDEVAERFGEDVATLVEAVTKIGALKFKDEKEYLASNHRKIFIAMAKDVRVILVKLADRLHNMRTLEFMPEEKQKKIASETLDVYAPIAHRLGISEIKNELEDLSFFYLNREEYYEIARMVEVRKSERDEQVTNMIEDISVMLSENDISYRIFGRSKHLYSIYKKMQTKHKRFEEILDLLAIRVVTDTDTACYEILGHIHAKYRPIPGRFKDYIAMPKVNMYQSLHTTIVGEDGHIFEIQIRTEDMNDVAELGIAAHWKYKEGGPREMPQDEIENQLHWFKDFSVMSDEVNDDAIAYMNLLQRDIFEANVYTMTPNGRVIALPNGATPIDFAYRVHTEIGNSMIGATVNGVLVPLNTELKTGDVVSIRTSKQSSGPSEDWLKFVKSAHARNKIRSFFQKQEVERKSSDIKLGEEMLKDELARRELDVDHYMETKRINSILNSINFGSYNDLMYAIGTKQITLQSVIERLVKHKVTVPKDTEEIVEMVNKNEQNRKRVVSSQSGVQVAGIDTIKVELAPCCAPIPGDAIVGFVTKGSGVKVHRKDCPNVADGQRLIDVEWEEDADKKTFETNIVIASNDRNFLLSDIVNTAAQCKVGLKHVDSSVIDDQLTVLTKLTVIVNDSEHLQSLVANLKKIDAVRDVQRAIK